MVIKMIMRRLGKIGGLKDPDIKYRAVMMVLMKNIEIDSVVKIIINENFKYKYKILKLLMK